MNSGNIKLKVLSERTMAIVCWMGVELFVRRFPSKYCLRVRPEQQIEWHNTSII